MAQPALAAKRVTVGIATDAGGDATSYTDAVTGVIRQVRYAPGSVPIDSGATITMTEENTGSPILTLTPIVWALQSRWRPLVAPVKAEDGTALTDEEARKFSPIAASRIKIVVQNGGSNATGTFTFVVG